MRKLQAYMLAQRSSQDFCNVGIAQDFGGWCRRQTVQCTSSALGGRDARMMHYIARAALSKGLGRIVEAAFTFWLWAGRKHSILLTAMPCFMPYAVSVSQTMSCTLLSPYIPTGCSRSVIVVLRRTKADRAPESARAARCRLFYLLLS